jgi:hypothetical protein
MKDDEIKLEEMEDPHTLGVDIEGVGATLLSDTL